MKELILKIIVIFSVITIMFVGCSETDVVNDKTTQENNNDNSSFSIATLSIPDVYKDVLFDYKKMVTDLFSDDFEDKVNSGFFKAPNPKLQYEWECMIIDSTKGLKNISLESFGYSICDINDDEIAELILLREDYFILAIFTINSDKPQLLDAYWYNHKGMILDSGNIFVFNNSSVDCYEYEIQALQKHGDMLITSEIFGCDDERYYKITNDEQAFITQREFNDILSYYPNISSNERKEHMKGCGIPFQRIPK